MVCLTFTELLTLLFVVSGLTALPGAAIGMLLLGTLQKRLGLKVNAASTVDVDDADDAQDETADEGEGRDAQGGQPRAGDD